MDGPPLHLQAARLNPARSAADTLLDTVSCSERFDGLRDSVKASIKALALKYGW